MCGILGIAGRLPDSIESNLRSMCGALSHRGPDDSGTWIDPRGVVALGQTRLSIIDLSPGGHQPMRSHSGRFVIVFNGEVYNYQEILGELKKDGPLTMRGHSDTEVMLEAIEAWGVRPAVERFRGMFAFALWDTKERVFYLVRDRMGVKPLYYGWHAGTLLFASELKALKAFPAFGKEIDRDALALFMQQSYIPAPHSIYRGIYKLPNATILTLEESELALPPGRFSAFADEGSSAPQTYWSLRETVEQGRREPFSGSRQDALSALESILTESVGLRMVADVPVGAFLSGGIDSSLVVALMQAQSSKPVRTFSIGFDQDKFNEAPFARKVAEHIGTSHTELYISASDALEVVPKLSQIYDEPFADSSQIPTYLVSKLARQQVTVSLSGDGGDELFAGYLRYQWAEQIWRYLSPLPTSLKQGISAAISSLPVSSWDAIVGVLNRISQGRLNFHNPGDKIQKLARVLTLNTREELYARLLTHWEDPLALVKGSHAQKHIMLDKSLWPASGSYLDLMMFLDMSSYLPDEILVKLDRASMAVSLEAREPLLDHKLIEFCWKLPNKWKTGAAGSKKLLREVLYKYVPKQLVDRPKVGFGVPIESWLRGPLRDWAEHLLDRQKMESQGYLNSEMVHKLWSQHLEGKRNWHYYLWDVLMFQSWLEAQS